MEPDTIAFINWKRKWDQRIEVLSLSCQGYSWSDILATEKREIQRKSLYKSKSKAIKEINCIIDAASHDKLDEMSRWADISHREKLNGIDATNLQKDQGDMWRRIAKRIPAKKKTGKWTAEKVKYAWHHGVSGYCPHLKLDPVLWTQELSQAVKQQLGE